MSLKRALTSMMMVSVVASLAVTTNAQETRPLDPTRFKGNAQLEQLLARGGELGPGARGEGVRAVQQALIDMGFAQPRAADGAFGYQTAKFVKNFQTHARTAFKTVRPTGTLDVATLTALSELATLSGRGQRWNVPSPRYQGKLVRIVVVKAERRTFLFDDAGKVIGIYQNAHGRPETPTHSALKRVDVKLNKAGAAELGQRLWKDPTVFGPRLIGLSGGGEELHGTNDPARLGEQVSHGCVRHANRDILKMYERVNVNDLVAIVERVNDKNLGAPSRAR